MHYSFNKILRYTFIVIYSLALLLVWGLGMLQIDIANKYTVAAVFLVSAYSATYFRNATLLKKGLSAIGPIIYVAVILFYKPIVSLPSFPISWCFLLFAISLFYGNMRSLSFHFFVIGVTFIYAFFFYGKIGNVSEADRPDKPKIETGRNLYDFELVNISGDTVILSANGKPFLVETWNQNCAPCLRSISDMQDTLHAISAFNHIYLYQSSFKRRLSADSVFSFDAIKFKEKIYIDVDNLLFDSLQLKSYPFFLIYDENGHLVNYFAGYNAEFKEKIVSDLFEAIDEAKSVQK